MPSVQRASEPRPGDVLLRGDIRSGFDILDAHTLKPIGERVETVETAIAVARQHGAPAISRQTVDVRGRPLSDAVLVATDH